MGTFFEFVKRNKIFDIFKIKICIGFIFQSHTDVILIFEECSLKMMQIFDFGQRRAFLHVIFIKEIRRTVQINRTGITKLFLVHSFSMCIYMKSVSQVLTANYMYIIFCLSLTSLNLIYFLQNIRKYFFILETGYSAGLISGHKADNFNLYSENILKQKSTFLMLQNFSL